MWGLETITLDARSPGPRLSSTSALLKSGHTSKVLQRGFSSVRSIGNQGFWGGLVWHTGATRRGSDGNENTGWRLRKPLFDGIPEISQCPRVPTACSFPKPFLCLFVFGGNFAVVHGVTKRKPHIFNSSVLDLEAHPLGKETWRVVF